MTCRAALHVGRLAHPLPCGFVVKWVSSEKHQQAIQVLQSRADGGSSDSPPGRDRPSHCQGAPTQAARHELLQVMCKGGRQMICCTVSNKTAEGKRKMQSPLPVVGLELACQLRCFRSTTLNQLCFICKNGDIQIAAEMGCQSAHPVMECSLGLSSATILPLQSSLCCMRSPSHNSVQST